MRILYHPIYENGRVHQTAVTQKRGLYDALCKRGYQVLDYDYLYRNTLVNLQDEVSNLIAIYQPDMMLTQYHGADPVNPAMLAHWRSLRPQMKICNWSGDSWLHSLTAAPMLELLRHVDLQLVAAPDVLPVYAEHGIQARYFNIAYEPPVAELPEMPTYDIVYLANVINQKRRTLMENLKSLEANGVRVGIYGDWDRADGDNVYNFAAGEALYKNAKIAIADNSYPEQVNYISNRPMQAMAAGGAILLHEYVPKMFELSGWLPAREYIMWRDWDDLKGRIGYWLHASENERQRIVKAGQEHVLANHTWGERVRVLFDEYLPEVCG